MGRCFLPGGGGGVREGLVGWGGSRWGNLRGYMPPRPSVDPSLRHKEV